MPLTVQDVGSRVVARRVVPGERGPTGGPAFTDVIGILESWQDGELRVRRRDGSVESIPDELLVAGKVVPPAPRRR